MRARSGGAALFSTLRSSCVACLAIASCSLRMGCSIHCERARAARTGARSVTIVTASRLRARATPARCVVDPGAALRASSETAAPNSSAAKPATASTDAVRHRFAARTLLPAFTARSRR
ncbi:MAG: hypothetical protein D6824_02460, partial [Planctomycetota bacterium]